jgi:hypothetical protein
LLSCKYADARLQQWQALFINAGGLDAPREGVLPLSGAYVVYQLLVLAAGLGPDSTG